MSPRGADKSAIGRILDKGVYAPLGLLISRDQVRDDLVKAGRKQVAFAQTLGRAALQSIARGVKTTSDKTPTSDNKTTSDKTPTDSPNKPTPAPAAEMPATSSQMAAQAADVAVQGYDALTAREVVTMLRSASTEQAQWIKTHETAGKGRVTILRAADSRLG